MKAASPAHEAWRLLREVFHAVRRGRRPAADLDLSPAQCEALRLLEPARPAPMGRLASGLACDASNVTGIVDRLEARGFIERRPDTNDRRVKVVAMTAAGAQVRIRLLARMDEPPELLSELSERDLRTLCAILQKALERSRGRSS
jgi:DNA-binding MarR family transcriptional regulator